MKEFLKQLFSGSEDVSSRRVNGTLCIITTVLIVIISIVLDLNIKIPQENLLSTIFWGGVVLLGATGVEKLIKK